MTGITRKTLDTAGGAQRAGGQAWFRVDGQAVVLKGDLVTPHGPPPHGPAPPVMVEGSDYVTISGVPVCRAGHVASCGHATTGAGWFTINGGAA